MSYDDFAAKLVTENAALKKQLDSAVEALKADKDIRNYGRNLGKSASGALTFYQKCLEAKDGDKMMIVTTDRNITLTISVEAKSGIVILDDNPPKATLASTKE